MLNNIFWITERIAQGRHPFLLKAYQELHLTGITHVLDLSDMKLALDKTVYEQLQIIREDVIDFRLIPLAQMLTCINAIHKVMMQPENKLYIHCFAGHDRSPTILWLYLIACGMNAEAAKLLIKEKNPHANPGGKSLIDHTHVPAAQLYGSEHGWTIFN
jgi:hypothetical protein